MHCPWNIEPSTSVRQISLAKNQQLKIKDMKFNLNPVPNSLKCLSLPFSNGRFLRFHEGQFLYKMSKSDDCECDDEDVDEDHSEDDANIWRILTLYVCIPVIFLGSFLIWRHETTETHERPEFIPYDHMRIRTRPFPWGDGNHTFFHNKCVNALPDGYEEEECHTAEENAFSQGLDTAKKVLTLKRIM